MRKRIYLDYASTTPLDKEVLEAMLPYFGAKWGNPSSLHSFGQEAIKGVDEARIKIANLIGAKLQEIVFTSGATEANNLAIQGIIKAYHENIKRVFLVPHIITSLVEHPSVLEVCRALEREGLVKITYLLPNKEGVVEAKKVINAITAATILISLIYGQNEVGVIEPIREVGKKLKKINRERQNKIYFHTDAVQGLEFLDCRVDYLKVDLMTISSHKIYGPKGVGALYIREGTKISPLTYGGLQEKEKRPGTENVPAIVGFGKAVELLKERHKAKSSFSDQIGLLRSLFLRKILKNLSEVKAIGPRTNHLPHILSLTFPFDSAQGETLLIALDQEGIAASLGSACKARAVTPSHVIRALGVSENEAKNTLRFSFGKDLSREDVLKGAETVIRVCQKLKKFTLSKAK